MSQFSSGTLQNSPGMDCGVSCKIEGGVKAGCVVEQREVGGLVTHSESDYSTLDLSHQETEIRRNFK